MKQLINNRLARYVFVGGISYVFEMAVLFGLREGVRLDPLVAVAISFWIGLVAAFLLQKYVAFQHHDARPHVVAGQVVVYGLLVGWNYIFTLAVAHFFAEYASIFVLRTIAILVVTVWNFAVYRILFRERKVGHQKPDKN